MHKTIQAAIVDMKMDSQKIIVNGMRERDMETLAHGLKMERGAKYLASLYFAQYNGKYARLV